MGELIRRDDVRREIQASFNKGRFSWQDGQDLMDRINALPTIDALPVVRCRECRWGHLCLIGQHLGLDGFCSKGEKEAQIIKSVTMREGDTDTDGFFRKAVEAVTEVQE